MHHTHIMSHAQSPVTHTGHLDTLLRDMNTHLAFTTTVLDMFTSETVWCDPLATIPSWLCEHALGSDPSGNVLKSACKDCINLAKTHHRHCNDDDVIMNVELGL